LRLYTYSGIFVLVGWSREQTAEEALENLKHLRPSSSEFLPEANDVGESGGHLGDRDGSTGHTALGTNPFGDLSPDLSFFLSFSLQI
jgi:hypothetical protein